MERKHGLDRNELLSWSQVLKSILKPHIIDIQHDHTVDMRYELSKLHKKYCITLVDKDGSGIAFVCKKIAHKLTKHFIYGRGKNSPGLFEQDNRPLTTVIESLYEYTRTRKIYTSSRSLPQFKTLMKMHKSKWEKAGRPISSEQGSVLQKLAKTTSAALHALRPIFQKKYLRILRRHRIYVEEAFNGPPINLDGNNGILTRIRAVNR